MTCYQRQALNACRVLDCGDEWMEFAREMVDSVYIGNCHAQGEAPGAVAADIRSLYLEYLKDGVL